MALEHFRFECRACGLRFEGDAGSAAESTPVSDGHAGDAYFRAFWCGKEGRLQVLDVESPRFTGRCPCGAQLTLLADFPLDSCPRCHVAQGVDKTPRRGTAVSNVRGRYGT